MSCAGKLLRDVVGIEPSGRSVVIEVKLARHSEARRAVIAQTLAYAAKEASSASFLC